MCNGWKIGCSVYLLTIVLSVVFTGACHFLSKLVIRTEEYKQINFSMIIFNIWMFIFALYNDVVTKQKWTRKIWAILYGIFWLALLIESAILVNQVTQLEFPNDVKVYEILRSEFYGGEDPFSNIHPRYQCCGYECFTDWKFKVYKNESSATTDLNITHRCSLPDIIPSCCTNRFYCGDHIFDLYNITETNAADVCSQNNNNTEPAKKIETRECIVGAPSQCPRIGQVIHNKPCKVPLKSFTEDVYGYMKFFMITQLILLCVSGGIFSWYFWTEYKAAKSHLESLEDDDDDDEHDADITSV